MSDIVEKAFLSFRQLIDGDGRVGGGLASGARSGLKNLVEATAGLTSKQDENVIMTKELALLQREFSLPGLTMAQARECLIRAIYCQMLGYPVTFAYIHAIKHSQLGSVVEKRIGYLAATLMLHDADQLVILIVNTIQKDLKSANVLNVCFALMACSHLIGSDMCSAVVDLVEAHLSHPKALVRRRAILTIHSLLLKCPSSVHHLVPRIKALVQDRDPGVVAAALYPLQSLAKANPDSFIDLIVPLMDVQRQIIHRKLPLSYDYRGVPAPWMQLRILQILAVVGQSSGAESIRPEIRKILQETLKRADVNQNCAHAVVCQCLGTLSSVIDGANRLTTTTSDNDELVESAFACIGRFLESTNPNLKYVGIKTLAQMVKCLSPAHVAKRQAVVMECLRSPDSSIRRQTLDVLFELTNQSNVEIVCPEMMKQVSDFEDDVVRGEILKKIFVLIDRWHPTSSWLLRMANEVLLNAGNELPLPEIVDRVKDVLLSNGPKEDHLIAETVTTHMSYLERHNELRLPSQMLELACWTLGHHPRHLRADVCSVLAAVAQESALRSDDSVAIGALTALEYIVAYGECQVNKAELGFAACLQSDAFAVRDRARELQRLVENVECVRRVFASPTQEAAETPYDWTLSFMDEYVVNSLRAGASPYRAPGVRADVAFRETVPASAGPNDRPLPSQVAFTASDSLSSSQNSSSQENHKVARKLWSKEGFHAFSALDEKPSQLVEDSGTGSKSELAKALFG